LTSGSLSGFNQKESRTRVVNSQADATFLGRESDRGIGEPPYPFHDKTVVVTRCGRLCLYRKKINLSTCLAGQAVGITEVEDGIWLVSFMQ